MVGFFFKFSQQLSHFVKLGAWDVQGLGSTFGKGNPEPSSREPPCQWNQAPVILIIG